MRGGGSLRNQNQTPCPMSLASPPLSGNQPHWVERNDALSSWPAYQIEEKWDRVGYSSTVGCTCSMYIDTYLTRLGQMGASPQVAGSLTKGHALLLFLIRCRFLGAPGSDARGDEACTVLAYLPTYSTYLQFSIYTL